MSPNNSSSKQKCDIQTNVSNLAEETSKSDEQIAMLSHSVRMRDEIISELRIKLKERDAQVALLAGQIDTLTQIIKDLRSSIYWKLTAPLRILWKLGRRITKGLTLFPQRLKLRLAHSRFNKNQSFRRTSSRISAWYKQIKRLPISFRILYRHKNSGLFDSSWYLQQNPDVVFREVRPFFHFAFHGVFEGRAPHAGFDTFYYFKQNPDVATCLHGPLFHYLLWGYREKRVWRPTFSQSITEKTPVAVHSQVADAASNEAPQTDIRAIAIYLPQFHPIPENNEWWGEGFTEWTNVRRAEPQYEGHYQPHVPHPDLGYYDLNDASVLDQQASMARAAGIEGFCFYYYWFNGKRLLNMPTDRLLATGRPDFPFCFCWANEDWTRTWDGTSDKILIGQNHSPESDGKFIHDLLPALRDERYIRVEGKPLLIVYRPGLLPEPLETARRWRHVCRQEGVGEIFLAYMRGFEWPEPSSIGFDAAIQFPPLTADAPIINETLALKDPASFRGLVRDYNELARIFDTSQIGEQLWPCVCPSWDNTARRMERAHSWAHATPESYYRWLSRTVATLRATQSPGRRFVFINAWNEWAEGCHLEPDIKFGYAWLNATKAALSLNQQSETTFTSLRLNSAVAAAHANKLQYLLDGNQISSELAFLSEYTALLSLFRAKGYPIKVSNSHLLGLVEGTDFAVEKRSDLQNLTTAIWGNADTIPFCFVLLQYNNLHLTLKCVESIRKLNARNTNIRLIIVDNGSSDQVVSESRELFERCEDVCIVFNRENLGFARGNNIGYKHAKDRFGDTFVVLLNNDVIIEDRDFIEKCRELFRDWSFSVLGPDIVTPDARHENPWNDYVFGIDGWRHLYDVFVGQEENFKATGLASFQRFGERSPQKSFITNPILQGACYIFSPIFVSSTEQPFDEATFLYGEEFTLSVRLLMGGHLSLYSSKVSVLHEEGVTTKLMPSEAKILQGYRGSRTGAELAALRLERQADAMRGRPFGIEENLIQKMTKNGQRHVLVDLFFCQPGFHGGGEYGKAVFSGLLEASLVRPEVQLWAALDPDLFIDEWIWEKCSSFGVNIVRVKSYNDIVRLVNMSCFYSFFAPAIVVYTGYEYMKTVGGDLKFDQETSTKVIGTLLDLRDFELAAEWETIAQSRREAGCRPEVEYNEREWEKEKIRNSDAAQKLAEMYQKICRHKSLTTLVTISSHSANSIRQNALCLKPIEVLFAPEKNRAQPEPFVWPGIDLEKDAYLLLLNASRPEKNAASAIAALDALFLEQAFQVEHQRLKLVIVGINNLTDLGIKKPNEHKRIVAMPHLSPGRLEYLLTNARGLLYPSFNEGFGYPPLEAMSVGVPCVVSECTSIPEVCGDAAIYCDPLSIQSIAASINHLLQHEPDTHKLKHQAAVVKSRQNKDLNVLASLIFGVSDQFHQVGPDSQRTNQDIGSLPSKPLMACS